MSSASKHEPVNDPNPDLLERSPSPSRTEDPLLNDNCLQPRHGLTIEQNIAPRASTSTLDTTSHRPFRPLPPGQLTLEEGFKILDSADALWNEKRWNGARVHYSTAAAIFHVLEDMHNEAFCLQRLGDVCRIIHDYPAARANICQAHVLFGRCGELARQLMCERWLARIASDQGMKEEAQQLLRSALDSSRSAGLRESQGWCLLRLGELNGTDKSLIRQAFDIAREDNIPLLESRCRFAASRKHTRASRTATTTTTRAAPSKHRTSDVVNSNDSTAPASGKLVESC